MAFREVRVLVTDGCVEMNPAIEVLEREGQNEMSRCWRRAVVGMDVKAVIGMVVCETSRFWREVSCERICVNAVESGEDGM